MSVLNTIASYTRKINEYTQSKQQCVKESNPLECNQRLDKKISELKEQIEKLRKNK